MIGLLQNLDFWWPCWINFAEKNDVRPSRFLICYSGDLSGNKSEEKLLLQFCGGLRPLSPRSSYLLTWRDDAPPVSVSRSEATGID